MKSSLAEKYSLAPSPQSWGTPLDIRDSEPDDDLHNPNSLRDRHFDRGGGIFTTRGLANLGCLFILVAGCLMLFAGYPVLSHFTQTKQTTQGGFNLGGINATGQIPDMLGNYGLVDRDTPKSAYTKPSYFNPKQDMVLVFSDEFNTDNRTFYPGDDPYWEAVDIHYWGTNDLEWYDPGQAVTRGGALRLTLAAANPLNNHNMSYKSAMVQTWNKFCFTGGLLEANVTLPGSDTIGGLWPAIWSMGNLGRAGFGATLEGLWPYSYDSCDVGTLPNQTYPGGTTPLAAIQNGDPTFDGQLSLLSGQRLSACTCKGESHPGPVRADGTYVGRASPEIDVFEAIVEDNVGMVSLSAQWAPYNAQYEWKNTTANLRITDPGTVLNPYVGGAVQQTTSGLAHANPNCYELKKGCFSVYGFEYAPGFDNGYITWINDAKVSWTIMSAGLAGDTRTEIGPRPVSQEPMYIIANLGISKNFGFIDLENLQFPATMSIDYIRVYQPANAINVGCDPANFPTAKYIETYAEAYSNFNLTTWTGDFKQPWPKNSRAGDC